MLSYFAAHQKPNGSLGRMPWWNFLDWVGQWNNGVAPAAADGSSAPLDLQLLLAYDWAADMESALGSPSLSQEYRKSRSRAASDHRQTLWKPGALFADTPERKTFSQHTNALAILAGVVEGTEAHKVLVQTLDDPSLAQASVYFRHYLHSAVNKADEGDRYLGLLDPWRKHADSWPYNLGREAGTLAFRLSRLGCEPRITSCSTLCSGLTPRRPDSVAFWCGLSSARSPKSVVRFHIPAERSRSAWRKNGNGLEAQVTLPSGVDGEFDWHGAKTPLTPGPQQIAFEMKNQRKRNHGFMELNATKRQHEELKLRGI